MLAKASVKVRAKMHTVYSTPVKDLHTLGSLIPFPAHYSMQTDARAWECMRLYLWK